MWNKGTVVSASPSCAARRRRRRALRSYDLWLADKDQAVWHRAAVRLEGLVYRAACGWQVDAWQGLVWPQSAVDAGPPQGDRCRTCT